MTPVEINTVTIDTGAVIKPGPMVSSAPAVTLEDAQFAQFAADSGLNAPFLADLLASCITHERDGVNLFRMLAAGSTNPMLQGKYTEMTAESEQAVEIWAILIRELGGTEQYVSPPARLTETMDSKIVAAFLGTGSADPLSIELAGVQATLMAAAVCVAHAQSVSQLSDDAKGQSQEAISRAAPRLTAMATKHYEWASQNLLKMTSMQAKHPLTQKVGQAVEGAVAKVKNAMH